MLSKLIVILIAMPLIILSGRGLACTDKASPYAGTFYANDFGYLADGCDPATDNRDGMRRFTDRVKRMQLGNNITADVGGEFRLRNHDENNHALSRPDGLDNTFFLTRLRLYGNLELGSHVRFYGEFIDARAHGEELGPRGIEEVHTDVLNGFVDFRIPVEDADLTLRIGRQELLFGAQRLISPLDWGNTRRSFDGARVDAAIQDLQLSAWFAAPRMITPDFNSRTDDDNKFAGVYAVRRFAPGLSGDLYVLNLATDQPTLDRDLWTIGVRHLGRHQALFWEFEAATQFGEIDGAAGLADTDIRSNMVTAGIGYDFKNLPWQPTVSLYYDRADGDDDPNDNSSGTFTQLFPLAHAYLGFIDLVGRQNIEAVSLRLILKPHKRFKFAVAAHQFRLAESSDALYNAGGAVIRQDLTGAAGRDVGAEIDITATAQLLDNVDLEVGSSHFFDGDFIDASNAVGAAGDSDFLYAQLRVRF